MSKRPVVQEYLKLMDDMLSSEDPVMRGICRLTADINGKHGEYNKAVDSLSKALDISTNDVTYMIAVGYDALHNRGDTNATNG